MAGLNHIGSNTASYEASPSQILDVCFSLKLHLDGELIVEIICIKRQTKTHTKNAIGLARGDFKQKASWQWRLLGMRL